MKHQRKRYAYQKNKKQKQPQALPQGTWTAEVTELLSDGRGLAMLEGRATMISEALPGERVSFEYTRQRKQFYEGKLTAVVVPSAERVVPLCPVFGQCGGCVLQHLDTHQQVIFKEKQLLGNLQKQAKIQPKKIAPPLVAEPWGYRHRARVGIKQVDGAVHLGFRQRENSQIIPIRECRVLAPELSDLLLPIKGLVEKLSQPDEISQVEMTLGDNGVALSFRHLSALTEDDLAMFDAFSHQYHVMIYLQADDATSVKGLNHQQVINYRIDIQTENDKKQGLKLKQLTMDFMPYHFTQVNFAVNRKMLVQALDWLDLQADDEVLDLFCGLGNFTLPIAQRVKRVVGVEGSKALVDWAKQNAEKNHIDNVQFYQADLTQDTQMMTWRVKHHYHKVVIDPPRAGAFAILPLIQALKPERICYVSCHAATLARDIDKLVNQYGYRLQHIGVMDMFVHTAHVESMALLVKK